MKKTLFLLLALWSLEASAQQLILTEPTNKNDKLSYSFVVKSEHCALQAQSIAAKIEDLLSDREIAIRNTPKLDTLSDVVITIPKEGVMVIDGQEIRYTNLDQASAKAAKFLDQRFSTVGSPTYSTLWQWGQGGYGAYRIPSVVALPNGNIVAFIEARAHSKHDQAENDIIAKISQDGGRSWSEQIMVAQAGGASLNNPCAVYVEQDHKIILLYQYYPQNITEGSSAVGVQGDNISRVFTVESMDDGRTWSAPKDITVQAKHPEANSICSGPGAAIRLSQGEHKGRIVVPFNANGSTRWFNYLLYSDDRGLNWQIAPGESGYGTNESQIVEIGDGELLMNTRSHRYPQDTLYTAPKGWNPWNFEKVTRNRANIRIAMKGDSTIWIGTKVQENLPDPTCQGSIIRIGKILLLSNPASQYTVTREGRAYGQTPPMRINGTVKVSHDWGKTWDRSKRIYGDRLTEFQYSVLVDLGHGKVGCLFEAGTEIKFASFDLKWLLK
ncbi:MAG: sialidase family protein [Mucinivorans sp.]